MVQPLWKTPQQYFLKIYIYNLAIIFPGIYLLKDTKSVAIQKFAHEVYSSLMHKCQTSNKMSGYRLVYPLCYSALERNQLHQARKNMKGSQKQAASER